MRHVTTGEKKQADVKSACGYGGPGKVPPGRMLRYGVIVVT